MLIRKAGFHVSRRMASLAWNDDCFLIVMPAKAGTQLWLISGASLRTAICLVRSDQKAQITPNEVVWVERRTS